MAAGGVEFRGVWGIVLAAGLSRRAAPHNKLLQCTAEGVPLVRIAVEAFCQAGLEGVLVVTGHQSELVMAALAGLPIREVHAPDYASGMGCSLAAGVRALPATLRGILVSPADLPQMNALLVRCVASAFEAEQAQGHVIPVCEGERGHPVALGAWLRPGLEGLRGDEGARRLLQREEERTRTRLLDTKDPGAWRDRDLGA